MHLGRVVKHAKEKKHRKSLIPGWMCHWECRAQRSDKLKCVVVGTLQRTWGRGHSDSNQEARATLSSQNTPVGEGTAWKNTEH